MFRDIKGMIKGGQAPETSRVKGRGGMGTSELCQGRIHGVELPTRSCMQPQRGRAMARAHSPKQEESREELFCLLLDLWLCFPLAIGSQRAWTPGVSTTRPRTRKRRRKWMWGRRESSIKHSGVDNQDPAWPWDRRVHWLCE